MVHGDDKGLVLPPRVANVQVILIPAGAPKGDEKQGIVDRINELADKLRKAGIRAKTDLRTHQKPGWKYNHWEQKGVPIRLEVGPKDFQSGGCVLVRRDNAQKVFFKDASANDFTSQVSDVLEDIHTCMFNKAKAELTQHVRFVDNWSDFVQALKDKCLIQAPFCGGIECEEKIKARSAADSGGEAQEAGAPSMGAKSLCIPFKPLQELKPGMKCICSTEKDATCITMFGRSY